jgi:hypothetical protein
MSRAWFEEVQRFRDNRWIWAFLAFMTLSIFLPLGFGMHQQFILGEPWGKEPMRDDGFITLMIFVTIAWGIALFMLISMKLETRIDEHGIHYRFFPLKPSWRLITPGEIREFTFEKKYKFFDSGKIGHHYNVFKKQRSFKIWGGKHIAITMTEGNRLLLGTQNLEEMEWAMKKLTAKMK